VHYEAQMPFGRVGGPPIGFVLTSRELKSSA
jgi:hypothetical protein